MKKTIYYCDDCMLIFRGAYSRDNHLRFHKRIVPIAERGLSSPPPIPCSLVNLEQGRLF